MPRALLQPAAAAPVAPRPLQQEAGLRAACPEARISAPVRRICLGDVPVHRRANRHGAVEVQRRHLVVDRRQMPMGQRHQAADMNQHAVSGWGFPFNQPVQHTALHMQHSFVESHMPPVQMKGLALEGQLDDPGIRHV
ncbi:hypothetical protein D3C81_1372660 [compost metagenome]